MRILRVAVLLAALASALGGCTTTHEGDIPWNAPASWEGSPSIPGMSN